MHVSHGESRKTPYHKAHSTEVVDLHGNPSGDDRYYNNLFVQRYVSRTDIGRNGLTLYDPAKLPLFMAGNVFLTGAKPSKHESNPLVQPNVDPGIKLVEKPDGMYLEITLDKVWAQQQRQVVTTALLGKATIPDLPYEKPDGSPYCIDTDYSGKKRNAVNPFPGPFELPEGGKLMLKVWPAAAPQ